MAPHALCLALEQHTLANVVKVILEANANYLTHALIILVKMGQHANLAVMDITAFVRISIQELTVNNFKMLAYNLLV